MKRLHKACLIFLVSLYLTNAVCKAQTTKGVEGNDTPGNERIGKTRALVIGISKYQYIESLKFADNDATEFASFLHDNRFWNIAAEDITLLKNDKAKCGDIIAELSRLIQISKPGDKVIFYFSGHGDIETITQFKNGYLLANDTYKNNYITGAIPVSFLKEAFVTLLDKDVHVFMFTDACRSGNLAGGLKGSEFAASAISSMWKNEIKILSSQPGQLSYEDQKWGNGRGVFSYYLTKGLSGEADQNKDSIITISELERYVGENVASATLNKQQPIFEGPNKFSTPIAKIYSNNKITNSKTGNAFHFILKNFITDDSCAFYYSLFNKAIEQNMINGGSASATGLYKKIKGCQPNEDLLLRADSKLMAALLKQLQEILNRSIQGIEADKTMYQTGIELADLLLSNNEIKTPYAAHLKNVRTYMVVMDAVSKENLPEKKSLQNMDKMLDVALSNEPEAAYLYNAKGLVNEKLNSKKIASQSFRKASQFSPTWQTPKDNLSKYNNTAQNKNVKLQQTAQRFIPGIKAGLNYSTIRYDKGNNPGYKTSFNAGATLLIKLSEHFAIEPEIIYSEEGSQQTTNGTDQKYSLNYIDVPILFKFFLDKNFSIDAGPQIGLLANAKLTDNNIVTDIKKIYSGTNISFSAGFSYALNKSFGLEGKWITGLQSINNNNGASSTKLSTGQIGFFYKFTK